MVVNIHLVISHHEEGTLRNLAAFLLFKRLYSNSCIYNYNVTSLSKRTGISRTSIKRYFQYFIDKGWARFHGNNLVLKRLKQVDKSKFIKCEEIEVNKNDTIVSVIDSLRHILLKIKVRQRDFVYKIRHDIANPKTTTDYKFAKKMSKKFNITGLNCESVSEWMRFSFRSMAKYLGISSASVCRMIQRLEGLSSLKVYRSTKIVIKNAPKRYLDALLESDSSLFYCSGSVMKKNCNEYIF